MSQGGSSLLILSLLAVCNTRSLPLVMPSVFTPSADELDDLRARAVAVQSTVDTDPVPAIPISLDNLGRPLGRGKVSEKELCAWIAKAAASFVASDHNIVDYMPTHLDGADWEVETEGFLTDLVAALRDWVAGAGDLTDEEVLECFGYSAENGTAGGDRDVTAAATMGAAWIIVLGGLIEGSDLRFPIWLTEAEFSACYVGVGLEAAAGALGGRKGAAAADRAGVDDTQKRLLQQFGDQMAKRLKTGTVAALSKKEGDDFNALAFLSASASSSLPSALGASRGRISAELLDILEKNKDFTMEMLLRLADRRVSSSKGAKFKMLSGSAEGGGEVWQFAGRSSTRSVVTSTDVLRALDVICAGYLNKDPTFGQRFAAEFRQVVNNLIYQGETIPVIVGYCDHIFFAIQDTPRAAARWAKRRFQARELARSTGPPAVHDDPPVAVNLRLDWEELQTVRALVQKEAAREREARESKSRGPGGRDLRDKLDRRKDKPKHQAPLEQKGADGGPKNDVSLAATRRNTTELTRVAECHGFNAPPKRGCTFFDPTTNACPFKH